MRRAILMFAGLVVLVGSWSLTKKGAAQDQSQAPSQTPTDQAPPDQAAPADPSPPSPPSSAAPGTPSPDSSGDQSPELLPPPEPDTGDVQGPGYTPGNITCSFAVTCDDGSSASVSGDGEPLSDGSCVPVDTSICDKACPSGKATGCVASPNAM